MAKELGRYEKVRMNDGNLYGYLEVRWSEKNQRWQIPTDDYDENGNRIWLYGTEIVTVEPKKKKFIPTAQNCTILVDVCDVSEKAYCYETGFFKNGKPMMAWVSKAICYEDSKGNVYMPVWAKG